MRPSRNTTMRSYCFTTRVDSATKTTTGTTTTGAPMIPTTSLSIMASCADPILRSSFGESRAGRPGADRERLPSHAEVAESGLVPGCVSARAVG